jgi:hypothetical protein
VSHDQAPWEQLFPPPAGPERAVTLRLRLVRKHGLPLLLVPACRAAAGEAMSLYPAQSRLARAARLALGCCLRAGLAPGTEAVALRLDPASAFVRFLFPAGVEAGDPGFALLCGNPHTPGRRFIFLVFDQQGRPQQLVKAGADDRARALIRAEAAFLQAQSAERLRAPAVRGVFSGDGLEAVAMQFAAGHSPGPHDGAALPELLAAWLDAGRDAAAAKSHPLFPRLQTVLGPARLHPAIFHGDFAPWNIRVDPATGRWTVLDWERGEPAGPPGWDWFHFVIQPEILVRRAGTEALAARVEELLGSEAFRAYARRAGMEESARALVLAYLLYCTAVIAPAEGSQATNELLNALSQRWLSA